MASFSLTPLHQLPMEVFAPALELLNGAAAFTGKVSIHIHKGDEIATDDVAVTATEHRVSRWLRLRIGDRLLVIFVEDAEVLRALETRLHHAALEMDLAEAALLQPPPAVVAAGETAREAVAAVEAAS
ncbi:MAG: hypothetical protein KGK07_07260 [Chloroflexota bacterium]|nr:hypothetical protein [Chloroflexota bacterium]